MKTENITKYVCDACKKEEYVEAGRTPEIREYALPVKAFSCNFSTVPKLVTTTVHLCADCSWNLQTAMSKAFDFYSIGGNFHARRTNDE